MKNLFSAYSELFAVLALVAGFAVLQSSAAHIELIVGAWNVERHGFSAEITPLQIERMVQQIVPCLR